MFNMNKRDEYLAKMKEAEEKGRYRFYGLDLDSLTDEELEEQYINMQNYLSDVRTHDC